MPQRSRGFTLLELGIVIGVSAILAAAIVPDLIETMRNRMAEKAAADVAVLHDAARLFYLQEKIIPYTWPGENSTGYCDNAYSEGKAILQLLQGGYLTGGGGPNTPMAYDPQRFLMNPWREKYEMHLFRPTTTTSPACLFGVSTNIPTGVADGFIAFLPMAACNAPGTATPCPLVKGVLPPAGFSTCCSYVPKPGAAANGPCPMGQTVVNVGGNLRCQ